MAKQPEALQYLECKDPIAAGKLLVVDPPSLSATERQRIAREAESGALVPLHCLQTKPLEGVELWSPEVNSCEYDPGTASLPARNRMHMCARTHARTHTRTHAR